MADTEQADGCDVRLELDCQRCWWPGPVYMPGFRDPARNAAFRREAERLRLQIGQLEKDKNIYLYNKKNEFRAEYSTFEDLELKLTNDRKTEKTKIQQQLGKIHHNVKRFQSQLKDVKPTPEFVEKLKEMMEVVENAISAFKEEQRQIYEELMKEEKITGQEISALEKKIEVWAVIPLATKAPKASLAKRSSIHSGADNVLAEAAEFDRFLQQTGGRQGSWDDFDHQNFLKVWTKHKGKPSFIEEALQYLPGRTEEDIKFHEQWYQEFRFLEERKKEAIEKWKTKKQLEREKLLKKQEHAQDRLEAMTQVQKENARLRLEKERKEKQTQVELWKKRKELELIQETEKQKMEEMDRMKKQSKENQRRLEVKRILEDFAQQKMEQEEFLQLEAKMKDEAEIEERRMFAAREIFKFQDRDLQKLKNKLAEKQAKQEAEAEHEKRLRKLKERVDSQIQGDPSRLFKPTKGWEEHIKERGPTGGGPVLYIPHRAVPSWRQGI
eukprot:gi/632959352/ref/XP_007895572.1/ PREDICTED: coiled-coil domain-containing protein 112 [Callorhinchus milii]